MSKAHPGFAAVVRVVSRKQGIAKKEAAAEIASASRNASPAAKKANPALDKIKG